MNPANKPAPGIRRGPKPEREREPMSGDTTYSFRVWPSLLKKAKRLGVNLPEFFRNALSKEVRKLEKNRGR